MFVPSHYSSRDDAAMLDVVISNPLAMLINNGPERPWITHLPAIMHPDSDPGQLEGSVLVGHMNKANPHQTDLVDGVEATMVFNGPNGYVSPTVYEIPVAAPTWDFVTIHVHGTIRRLDEQDDALRVVSWTVDAFEKLHGTGWDKDGSMDHFRRIVPAVSAFEFEVTSVDAMFKLSQELSSTVRDRVVSAFEVSSYNPHYDLSSLIARAGKEQE